jgi:hypothetical protein
VKHQKVDRPTFFRPYIEAMDALFAGNGVSDFVPRAGLQVAISLD